jgi:hypothetical protein
MTPTKLLGCQTLIVFAIVIEGVWFAIEWSATELGLGFRAKLGVAWFGLVGRPVHRPGQLLAFWCDAYASAIFNKAIAASSGIVGSAVATIGSLLRVRQNRRVATDGSSRWGTGGEIGQFRSAGVFLGRLGRKFLRRDGREEGRASLTSSPTHVYPAPILSWNGYREKPAPRPDDWSGQVRGLHVRLAAAIDDEAGEIENEGGFQRQRHPVARRVHLEAEPGRTGARSCSRRRIRCRRRQDGHVPAAGSRHGRSRPHDGRGRAHRVGCDKKNSGDIDRQSSNWTTR